MRSTYTCYSRGSITGTCVHGYHGTLCHCLAGGGTSSVQCTVAACTMENDTRVHMLIYAMQGGQLQPRGRGIVSFTFTSCCCRCCSWMPTRLARLGKGSYTCLHACSETFCYIGNIYSLHSKSDDHAHQAGDMTSVQNGLMSIAGKRGNTRLRALEPHLQAS